MDANYKWMVCAKCMTFNQSRFIGDTLQGFLMQKTTFPMVCCIVDDASTDGEPDLLRSWAKSNLALDETDKTRIQQLEYGELIVSPMKDNRDRLFVILLLKENHFGKKEKSQYLYEWSKASKYIALCEGDDYWTDSNKTERQVRFLESNPKYVACAENSTYYFIKTGESRPFSDEEERDMTVKELIYKRRFGTASVLFRAEAENDRFNSFKYKFDTMLWCHLASLGKFRYLENVSSVYRRGAGVTEKTDKLEWLEQSERWYGELFKYFRQYITQREISQILASNYWWGIRYYGRRARLKELFIVIYRYIMLRLGLRAF